MRRFPSRSAWFWRTFAFTCLFAALPGCSFFRAMDRGTEVPVFFFADLSARTFPIFSREEMASFQPAPDSALNRGFTSETIWLRFVVPPGAATEFLLEVAYPPLDEVTLFTPGVPGGLPAAWTTGDRRPFASREINHRNFIFRVRASTAPYYLRIKTESAMVLPLRLYDTADFLEKNRVEQFLLGTFFGCLFIMALYNSFLYLTLRDRAYLFYVFMTGSSWFYFFVWNGLAFEFFWPEYALWNNAANPFFQSFASICLYLFVRSFLGGLLPRAIDRFFLATMIPCAVAMALALMDRYDPAIKLVSGTNVLSFLVALPTAVLLLWRGFRPARFLILAWAVALGAMFLNVLRMFHILPVSFFTQVYALQIGAVFELALLSLALADRFRLLEHEKEEARQSSAAKSAFLANVSHEIRTPLHAILGMTELLQEEATEESARKKLSVLKSAGQNLLTVINDVLDISKIESGRLDLESVDFFLEDILNEAVDLILPEARAKGLEVALFYDPHLPLVVRGDPTRLRQVLINLMSNAAKFTETGEIKLEARREADRSTYCHFSVSDTGIGINQEKWEDIFEAFTQADDSTTRRYGGTGLGLTICRRLVDLMGGKIGVESFPGKGSRFYFAMPLPAAVATAPAGMIPVRGGGRALLVVNPGTTRQILREYLHATGIPIEETTASALLEAPPANHPAPVRFIFISEEPRGATLTETLALARGLYRSATLIVLSPRVDFLETGDPVRLPVPLRRAALVRLLGHEPPARTEHEDPVAPALSPVNRPLRILLAEDNEDNRGLFLAFLKRTPHQITVAADGKAALEEFTRQQFDLIFVDIQMPVMDGLTATRRMRAFEAGEIKAGRRLTRVPIYALTANVLRGEIDKSLEAGCDDHIGKPMSRTLLLEVVSRHSTAN